MFHAEYCLFCGTFSRGKNRRDCGRPCHRHTLRLRDRLGVEHLVLADSQCRNTVFHAEAENLSEAVPALRKRGVRHFRVELLAENTAEQVRRAARGLSIAVWEVMMQGSDRAKLGEDARAATSWWSRRCGGRDVLTLAIPLVVSTASWTVMNFIDRMFLLWHSTDEMAAAMPAGMVHFALVCFPLGVASYVNTFVAQYHGAGHPQRIGPAVWQGVRVGLLCVPLYLALIPLAPWLFRLVGHEARMAHLEAIYFQTVALGAGAEVIAGALSAFFTGLGINRVVMIVDTSAALMNAVLDYGWIFGHFGLPALGIEGAAWATVTSLWFRVVAYAAWMMLPRYRQPYQLWSGRRFQPALLRRLLRYGGPNGLQMLVEIAGFTVFLLLVGTLGPAGHGGHHAGLQREHFGLCADARPGNRAEHDRRPAARPRSAPHGGPRRVDLVVDGGGLHGRDGRRVRAVARCAAAGSCRRNNAGAIPPTSRHNGRPAPLRGGLLPLRCPQRGLRQRSEGRRRHAIHLAHHALDLAAAGGGRLGGNPLARWDLLACWVVVTLWVSALGLIYLGRFLQGRWRLMRVIEPELLGEQLVSAGETRAPCRALRRDT